MGLGQGKFAVDATRPAMGLIGRWQYRLLGIGLMAAAFIGTASALHAQTPKQTPFSLQAIVDRAVQAPKSTDQFDIPFEYLRSSDLRDLPIGVFDSGVGGLTVLETILGLDAYHNETGSPGADGVPDFQNERFIYLGDQANMPYGNYSSIGSTDFLRELIVRDAMFLLGTNPGFQLDSHRGADSVAGRDRARISKGGFTSKEPVKAIVIACNTATAFGLEDIREAISAWDLPIPVIGVVEAGASTLVQEISDGGEPIAVAVMATVGTCASNAYPKAITRAAGLASKRIPTVWQQGSLGLAGAIEGNPAFVSSVDSTNSSTAYQGPSDSHATARLQPDLIEVYDFAQPPSRVEGAGFEGHQLRSIEDYVKFDVVDMVEKYRQSGATAPISKVILGCTHFPFEADKIQLELARVREYKDSQGAAPYRELISDQVELIDPAELTARQLYRTLLSHRIGAKSEGAANPPMVEEFYFSVANPTLASGLDAEGALTTEYKYSRDFGWSSKGDTRISPLRSKDLPSVLAKLLHDKCRYVWGELERIGSQE